VVMGLDLDPVQAAFPDQATSTLSLVGGWVTFQLKDPK